MDGNIDGVWADKSVSHTGTEASAWWEVDLGAGYALHAVRLWNRTDCCSSRLGNLVAMVSPKSMSGRSLASLLADKSITKVSYTGPAKRYTTLSLAGTGRYLRIQLKNGDPLALAEVQAYGKAVANHAPTIAKPSVKSLMEEQPVSQKIDADDADDDDLTFSATGLPAGLTISASSGVISGKAKSDGVFTPKVTVRDARGASASTEFAWTVLPAKPVINTFTATPAAEDSSVKYVASATGDGTLRYQWNFGDGSAVSKWSTSSTITHTYANSGVYTVTLTVQTAEGVATTRSFLQAVTHAVTSLKPRASSALALETRSGASARLWATNPDNNSVSVFDTATNARVAEISVGTDPRTLALAPNGDLWVVNKGSASISVIDTEKRRVIKTIALPRASQPFGIVFSPSEDEAYVSYEALGQVAKIDTAGKVLDTLAVGANPRHLSINGKGSQLLVSRFITPALPGEGSAKVGTVDHDGDSVGAQVVVVKPSSLSLVRTIVLQHSESSDSATRGRGIPNYLGAAVIAPDGKSAWVPSKQDNIKRGSLRDGFNLNFQNTVRAVTSRIDLSKQTEDLKSRLDHDNSSVATAAAFHPNGAYLFVALETSRQVAVIDAARERELFRVDVGRAPQALLMSADGKKLYVQNFTDRSISVLDLGPLLTHGEIRVPTLATAKSVTTEKLATNVLKGKQFFYDARDTRLARDGYLSCGSCHADGGYDGRTWDLTGLGEGLRNTPSLRGRAGAEGLKHWSGNFDEIQDFEGQIRSLAQGTGLMKDSDFNAGTREQPLGTKKAGVSADLDALAAYVTSLKTFSASPYRSATGALSTAAVAGRALFDKKNCASCHGGTAFTNSGNTAASMKDIGTIKPSSGKRLNGPLNAIDIPTLRDVWQTAPYLHDGSAPTLASAVLAHKNLTITSAEAASLASYLREIGSDEKSAP